MSQANKILNVLIDHPGEYVAMPKLANAANCFAVNSRVSDLRERGYDIECKLEREGHICHSYYKLTGEATS